MANRIIRDIPELVATLRAESARCKDLVVPNSKVKFVMDGPSSNEETLALRIEGKGLFGIQKQTHGQIAQKFGEIPKSYYDRMLASAQALLTENLNHWRTAEQKNHLVRLIDGDVRAVLSDRYRPISHLDVLTSAVQVITREGTPSHGARCFGWNVSPTRLDVCIMNPTMQLDLNDLGKGVQFDRAGEYRPDAPNHGWVKAEKEAKAHWVFPALFMGNSETGHGGLSVEVGLYEAICDNTARLGQNLAQRHLGRTLEEDEVLSAQTYEKMNAVIFSKVADVVRSAFDPTLLLANAKKMKGLADVEVDVKEAVSSIVKLPGITEGIRDDIFAAYKPLGTRDTLLDVQRAVTAAAHAVRETQYDLSVELEKLGGALIESGKAALVLK